MNNVITLYSDYQLLKKYKCTLEDKDNDICNIYTDLHDMAKALSKFRSSNEREVLTFQEYCLLIEIKRLI